MSSAEETIWGHRYHYQHYCYYCDDGDCDVTMTGYDDDGDMKTPMMWTSNDALGDVGYDGGGAMEMSEGGDVVAVAVVWLMNYVSSFHYCSCHYVKRVRAVVSVG